MITHKLIISEVVELEAVKSTFFTIAKSSEDAIKQVRQYLNENGRGDATIPQCAPKPDITIVESEAGKIYPLPETVE